MALERGENAEARMFAPVGQSESAGLSRSAQDYFQPIDRAIASTSCPLILVKDLPRAFL